MGNDIGNAECGGGVPPSSGSAYIREFILASRGGGMGVFIGGRGLGGSGYVANEGVYL